MTKKKSKSKANTASSLTSMSEESPKTTNEKVSLEKPSSSPIKNISVDFIVLQRRDSFLGSFFVILHPSLRNYIEGCKI